MFRQDIANVPLFKDLNPGLIDLIRPLVETCQFPEDQVVFEQGDIAHYLYVVIAGQVVIRYKPYDGPPLTVTRVAPGGVFGWSAALGREVYTSSAICSEPTEVYRISGQNLHCLCKNHPETGTIILERLANVIAERLQNTHAQIVKILGQGIVEDGDC
jgi:CRP-like cAMP-binding protein